MIFSNSVSTMVGKGKEMGKEMGMGIGMGKAERTESFACQRASLFSAAIDVETIIHLLSKDIRHEDGRTRDCSTYAVTWIDKLYTWNTDMKMG